MVRRTWLLALAAASLAHAQLVPGTSPIPKTANPPVIFLGGYQIDCGTSSFSSTFGKFDQVMQRAGRVSVYFENCTFGKVAIEDLGNRFGDFLNGLKYQDGSAVTQVDVVAHSMGGLIVRSYLAGKQTSGAYQPPAAQPIRKAIFLATPHFGTLLALGTVDTQVTELSEGSTFLFDLATWNQGMDDLRGVDALSVVGNGGNGVSSMPKFDDGVVTLTSGSLGFARPNRTRILPTCHTASSLLVLAGLCSSSTPILASVNADSDPTSQIALSFLNGTADWQSVGQAAEQNNYLSVGGGVWARAKSATDQFLPIDNANGGVPLKVQGTLAYASFLDLRNPVLTQLSAGGTTFTRTAAYPVGTTTAIALKQSGPVIGLVYPAAALLFPRGIAPGSIASVYGANFDGARLYLDGSEIQPLYADSKQLNFVVPSTLSTLTKVTVRNASGENSVNVVTYPVLPAVFVQDAAGTASALNAVTGALVTTSAPLRGNDYVSLYLTGLGPATIMNGLEYATTQPTVTVGGQACAVTYAGRAPGFPGLDQINCRIPAALASSAAAPVIVTSAGRSSNTATVAIQ